MRISVLCVTLNRPHQLQNAIRMFRAQTWTNKELIVIDDSDKDKQLDLSHESDIKHIKIDRLDCGLKHDVGLDHAQGDVIGYQDDDDYFGPKRLELEMVPLLNRSADVVGIPRDLLLRFPEVAFSRMKEGPNRPPLNSWIGNGLSGFKWSYIHDSTALVGRWAITPVNKHGFGAIGQKVKFLNSLYSWGKSLAVIPNDGLFVYVRHSKNSWQFNEEIILQSAIAPQWLSPETVAEMADAARRDGVVTPNA